MSVISNEAARALPGDFAPPRSLPAPRSAPAPGRLRLAAALALVYLVWGSTFLAIRYAVETIPPFLLMGVRSLLAGLALYAWARVRGAEAPRRREWVPAAVVGALLFLGCHGTLAWAERRVASGVAAVVLATIPFWMALLDWVAAGGPRPAAPVWAGLASGMVGLAVLLRPEDFAPGRADLGGLAALLGSAFAWAAGSIAARRLALPRSILLAAGMQLIAGGLLVLGVSVASGEAAGFAPDSVAPRSILALLYLVVLGSVVTFTAYVWLLRVSTPARAGSCAFVNPLVAVLVGSTVGAEPLSWRTGLAASLIVAGAATLVLRRTNRDRA